MEVNIIAYMYNKKYAPSTVSSNVSALGYSHIFLGHRDPTKAFFIIQILKGYGKIGSRFASRLPITRPVLNRIIESLAKLAISQYYQRCQFQAMCLTAFFAFLQIGEITYNLPKDAGVPLQVNHLAKLVDFAKRVVALKLTFGNFKQSYNQCPFSIIFHRHNSRCLVRFLLDFLSLRGNRPGPLFINSLISPVSRAIFAELLSLPWKACGLDSTHYKSHSFRIGASSFAAEREMSDAEIRALGHWRSNAFL